MQIITSIVILISIVLGLLYGLLWVPRENSITRSILKTLPVSLLAVAALISGAPILLFLALILSAAGDAFLSRDGEPMFLAGLGSFLSAHLVYVILFLNHPAALPSPAGVLTAVAVVTLVVIVLVLSNLWNHLGAMKLPVIIYTLVIGAMNISAWGTGQSALLLTGVTLFVFSDMVLAHELFFWQKPAIKKLATYTVWFSYFAAQTIILYSFL